MDGQPGDGPRRDSVLVIVPGLALVGMGGVNVMDQDWFPAVVELVSGLVTTGVGLRGLTEPGRRCGHRPPGGQDA